MKNSLIAGVSGLLFVASSHSVLAAEDPLTVVVTASRIAETVDEAMAPVTVITRQEIESSGAVSVPELLSRVPGINITRNGGRGQSTSVFLRGTESDHTLVLIDGVEVGSATLGTTPYQDLPLDHIEKIEVVRGPRSSLYGSEAIGGVIQIFTRRGGNGTRPIFSVSGGSHDTSDVNVGVTGGSPNGWYAVQASNYDTEGFDACRGNAEAGCFTDEPDDDGYENTSVSLRAGGQFGEGFSLEGGILNADSETEFDGSFQNSSESLTRVSHVKAGFDISDTWSSSLLVAQAKDESDNFLNGEFASRFNTERDQLSFQNDIELGGSRVIVGVDYTDEEVSSDSEFAETSRDNTGLFASFNTGFGANDFELSVRNDDNEQFGNETTGGVAVGRDLGGDTRVVLSYGTAFKAPTFNELYFPDFGNPDLVAETSNSVDLGLTGKSGNTAWAVNLFRTEIEDLIGFDSVTFLPVNIDEVEITGLELSGSMDAAGWDISANVTFQNPENSGGGTNDGNQLARRPKEFANLSIDRGFGALSLGAGVFYSGKRFDDLANQNELDSYTLIDLHGEYRFTKRWSFGIKVNNVFDEEYETARFYNQDGVNALATLRYIPR